MIQKICVDPNNLCHLRAKHNPPSKNQVIIIAGIVAKNKFYFAQKCVFCIGGM